MDSRSVEHPKWAMEEKRTTCHKAVELRHELRKVFGTPVTLGPSDPYFMEDEAPPGVIYEEETLDEEELKSGKLKKATAEDQLNRAVKKTRVSIAEPEDTSANDKDNDVCMQDMESGGAYTQQYDTDSAVMKECQDEAMADWEDMPTELKQARQKRRSLLRRRQKIL
jgi:hypothetical protein